jgi:hypothetical protein
MTIQSSVWGLFAVLIGIGLEFGGVGLMAAGVAIIVLDLAIEEW